MVIYRFRKKNKKKLKKDEKNFMDKRTLGLLSLYKLKNGSELFDTVKLEGQN